MLDEHLKEGDKEEKHIPLHPERAPRVSHLPSGSVKYEADVLWESANEAADRFRVGRDE